MAAQRIPFLILYKVLVVVVLRRIRFTAVYFRIISLLRHFSVSEYLLNLGVYQKLIFFTACSCACKACACPWHGLFLS